jgi:hypothetical protein
MPKEVIIFLKKVDPKNPHHQEAIYIHDETVAASLTGSRKSPKVSDIRFDEGDQRWVAVLRDGKELCRNKNRNVVVQEEATLIAGMFARGEYIPGGYNGEPSIGPSSLNLNLQEAIAHHQYLGKQGGVTELYATGPLEKINCVIVYDRGDFIVFEADGNCDSPGSWADRTGQAGLECVRRYKIEMQIAEEEKIKIQSHA